jgi:adenosylmethionine-8-amino-7-oxononanoate aminotransferase
MTDIADRPDTLPTTATEEVTGPDVVAGSASEHDERLQALARRHLWMHFSRMGHLQHAEVPTIVRGQGCHVWDDQGRRYLDGLSGLFVSQVGYGRRELAEVAATQAETLHYFPVWSYAHPPAIELAARLAELAPGELNRVFFTTSGSEAVETALKLARQYHRVMGEPGRYKVISRATAYHGVSLGALAITGVPALRAPFEPMPGGFPKVPNTNQYRPAIPGLEGDALTDALVATLEQTILAEGPQTVAAVFMEPMQNAGGCLTPPSASYFPKVREICDRYGVLLVSDEVICGFGRLGTMFGCERYGYEPDIITVAKGLTSGYAPLGAAICSDRLIEPFLEDERLAFAHGITFGGHPVSCAVGLANLDVMERESVVANVAANGPYFGELLAGLHDLRLVGDTRGDGYFRAIELVKDAQTKERFSRDEVERLLRGTIAPRMYELGLIARVDDRGDPVIQFAPPLIAGRAELERIAEVMRTVLSEASATI